MGITSHIIGSVIEVSTPGVEQMSVIGDAAIRQGADTQSLLASVGGGLGIVLVVIMVAAFVYARFTSSSRGNNGVVNIVASQTIGPRERLTIVEVGGTQILIGMTPAAVQTLHVFDKPVTFDNPQKNNFAERLRTAMRRKN